MGCPRVDAYLQKSGNEWLLLMRDVRSPSKRQMLEGIVARRRDNRAYGLTAVLWQPAMFGYGALKRDDAPHAARFSIH